ncbi:hypothetical protein PoB_005812700 [Plakobranchus ocellatus]|uniref:Uncharacterized protein n=1 Tax=Plakobranchus ocellatus TaxID=259542 RepID=A0AAV4CJP3_9GAST|nr:hypothetical protein PoB_005812700 [Plakobranchus ocellatus]
MPFLKLQWIFPQGEIQTSQLRQLKTQQNRGKIRLLTLQWVFPLEKRNKPARAGEDLAIPRQNLMRFLKLQWIFPLGEHKTGEDTAIPRQNSVANRAMGFPAAYINALGKTSDTSRV